MTEVQLLVVDLGDAKAITRGPMGPRVEDHPTVIYREI
jgi:hypothetical protein